MQNVTCFYCNSSDLSIISNKEVYCNVCKRSSKITPIDFEKNIPKSVIEEIKNNIIDGHQEFAIKKYQATAGVSTSYAKTAIDAIQKKYSLQPSKNYFAKILNSLIIIFIITSIMLKFTPIATEAPFFILSTVIILAGIRMYYYGKNRARKKAAINEILVVNNRNVALKTLIITILVATNFSFIDPGNKQFLEIMQSLCRFSIFVIAKAFIYKFMYYSLLTIIVIYITRVAIKKSRLALGITEYT